MDQFRVEMFFEDGSQDEQTVSAMDEHAALGRCLYMDADYVTITRVRHPSDWERYGGARVGDIWEADGKEYAALWANRPDDGNISVHGVEETIMYDVQELKAMNPRLVRRRGVTIEG